MTPEKHEAHAALVGLLRIGGRLRLEGEKVVLEWNGPRDAALAERLRAVKPDLRAMLTRFATLDELAGAAVGLFNGTIIADNGRRL